MVEPEGRRNPQPHRNQHEFTFSRILYERWKALAHYLAKLLIYRIGRSKTGGFTLANRGPMARKEILDQIQKYVQPFRVTKGKSFQLKNFDPGDTCGLKMGKREASELLQRGTEWLAQEQDMLYAQDRWSLLLVFQAMDAAGKDSTIRHVMSGVNPQGCQVFSFKQPSQEELSHDFMWRYSRCLPERGRIGIFNRSYYEEVLVVRVHEEILKQQKLPDALVGKHIWDERLADIAH